MAEIRNLTRNGETFYPQTHIEGVLDPGDNYIGHYEENPEYMKVELDSEGRVLKGVRNNGIEVFGVGYEVDSIVTTVIDNPEFLTVYLDRADHILWGIRKDGSVLFGDVPSEFKDYVEQLLQPIKDKLTDIEDIVGDYIDNPEYNEVKVDAENKILEAIKTDGTKVFPSGVEFGGNKIDSFNDPEGRLEMSLDGEEKVISCRKFDGTLVENVGIETNHLELSEEGQKAFEEKLISDGIGVVSISKNYFLPKFGTVNIKQETFYLTYDARYSSKSDIVLIQMLDDTSANAAARRTLSYYYIKSTLTPLPGGEYDRTSVNENSVRLDFYPAKEVAEDSGNYYVKSITKVNNTIYFTSTLTTMEVQGVTVYSVNSNSVALDLQIEMDNQQTLTNAVRVTQIVDVPPYKAWTVNKKLEHYCVADIDFGTFYSKNNVPVSIKYQGSASTQQRMRGLRITFFKKDDYKKKDKIKIGEMIRLSGFNMKAYFSDDSMIKDPMLSNIFIETWNTRGKEAYPWNKDSVPYSGATGFIKSFPIETYFGTEFYGIQSFGIKKDEKNYMLDGDDDGSGIFVTGNMNSADMWTNSSAANWVDEMEADGRELAYPNLGDESVSVETAAAINELLAVIRGFINDTVSASELEEHIDLESFIDYWIGLQCFMLWDNEYHNLVLHTRSDKKKFYAFFYDLDNSMSQSWPYDTDLIEACTNPEHHIHPYNVIDMRFWEKFIDEYKDSIINRYIELRKTVLSIDNITAIYNAYTENIPQIIIEEHQRRWNISSTPEKFKTIYIEYLKSRLAWLDDTYFNI